jgi:hypothetical protein
LGYMPPAKFAVQCLQRVGGIDQGKDSTTIVTLDSESSCC